MQIRKMNKVVEEKKPLCYCLQHKRADCGREPYLDGGLGEWITLAELGLVTRITLCLIGCGKKKITKLQKEKKCLQSYNLQIREKEIYKVTACKLEK
jgi:hypothetical protein